MNALELAKYLIEQAEKYGNLPVVVSSLSMSSVRLSLFDEKTEKHHPFFMRLPIKKEEVH